MIVLRDAYTRAEFAELVARETTSIELKRGVSVRALQEALVALSNADGGVIFVGVTDDREVVGCSLTQGVDDRIHDSIHAAHDVGSVEIRELSVGDTPVVAVEVQPRRDGFAQTSDGRILVRRGARNRALVGADIWRFLAERQLTSFENTESTVSLSDCDAEALAELARAHGWTDDDDIEARLRERNLLGKGQHLTVAGALLLTDPATTMSASKFGIDIRGYDDPTSSRYVRRDDILGPLPQQVRQAAALVSRDVGTEFFVPHVQRRDVPRLPRDVVREAIANAVAHRSYEERGAAVVIEIRPDRVVVTSPGGFPEGVTAENLRSAQKARNPAVIDVLRRFELAEDTGRGIDLIEDEMSAAFLMPPTFEERDGTVIVTLPLHGLISTRERAWVDELQYQGKLGQPERLLLVHAARGTPLTNATARTLTGQDSADARRSLAKLRDEGLLIQHGARGGSTYTMGQITQDSVRMPSRERLEQVVIEAAANGPVTNSQVRDLTGLDRHAARTLLQQLVDRRLLIKHGERRGTTYTLAH